MSSDDKPDLQDAGNTDDIYSRAFELAAWGLRHGVCDEFDALDWVLSHPHDDQLPRGSRGTLNPTLHHIDSGVSRAVEQFDRGLLRATFNPEPLQALAARIDGSGIRHERYLLGVIALCFKYETLTPVVTGPLLAEVVGVNTAAAGRVLKSWSDTLAYGFFASVRFDGQRGHGRIWTVDPDWTPTTKPKHSDGCNRSKGRCQCPGLSQNGRSIYTAEKDRSTKVRQFAHWLGTLPKGKQHQLDVTTVAREMGVTRHQATKLLRSQQGDLLDEFTYPGGSSRRRQPDGSWRRVRKGETWFVK